MLNMSTILSEDLHHPVPKSGYTTGGLGGLGMGLEGVSLGPGPPPSGGRIPAMFDHQAPRPHSPPLSSHPKDKRTHSGNKAQANADRMPQLNPTSLHGHNRLTRRFNVEKKDPLSHRIIEKRRRDRMNNCLADLSRLIPAFYTKKGRGRIEKTEIIEMAIKYMKNLKEHECQQLESCELATSQKEPPEGPSEPKQPPNQTDLYHMGYQDAINETMHFLNESEGLYPGDSLCVRLLNHLNKHQNDLMGGDVSYSRAASGASSSSSGYHANGSSNSSSDGNGNASANSSDNKDTDITEESAYCSEDQPFPEDRDDKSSSRYDANQLREMLQRESFQFLGGSDHSPEFTSGSYSQYLSSNNSSSGDDNGARLYKFKSNMKNRFTTDLEHSHQVRKRRRDSESSNGNYTDYEKDCGTPTGLSSQPHNAPGKDVKRIYQNSPLLEKSLYSRKPIKEESIPSPNDVPIFALNKNGSFYIPLTIDHSLIAKGMARIIETTPVLHPVSIFVNFSVPSSDESDKKFDNHYPSKQMPNISRDGEVDNRIPENSHDCPPDVCRDTQLSNPSYNDLKLRSGLQSLNVEDSENFDKQNLFHPADIPHDTCHELPREHHKMIELRQGDHLPQGLRERIEPHFNGHQLPQEHTRDVRENRENLHHPDQYELQERHKLSQVRVRRELKQSPHEFTEKTNYSGSSSYGRGPLPNWLQPNYQVKKL